MYGIVVLLPAVYLPKYLHCAANPSDADLLSSVDLDSQLVDGQAAAGASKGKDAPASVPGLWYHRQLQAVSVVVAVCVGLTIWGLAAVAASAKRANTFAEKALAANKVTPVRCHSVLSPAVVWL